MPSCATVTPAAEHQRPHAQNRLSLSTTLALWKRRPEDFRRSLVRVFRTGRRAERHLAPGFMTRRIPAIRRQLRPDLHGAHRQRLKDHDIDPLAATVSRSAPIVSSARQTSSRHRER
jgi:hypothetical protein